MYRWKRSLLLSRRIGRSTQWEAVASTTVLLCLRFFFRALYSAIKFYSRLTMIIVDESDTRLFGVAKIGFLQKWEKKIIANESMTTAHSGPFKTDWEMANKSFSSRNQFLVCHNTAQCSLIHPFDSCILSVARLAVTRAHSLLYIVLDVVQCSIELRTMDCGTTGMAQPVNQILGNSSVMKMISILIREIEIHWNELRSNWINVEWIKRLFVTHSFDLNRKAKQTIETIRSVGRSVQQSFTSLCVRFR